MKKITLLFACVLISTIFFSFNEFSKLDSFNSSENTEKLNSDLIKTVHNKELNLFLEAHFISLFDKVDELQVVFLPDIGYCYVVYGSKKNIKTINYLKIEEEDVINETYTYIDFSNIEITEDTQYCHKPRVTPSLCPNTCEYYGSGSENCDLITCGVYNGGQCLG